MAVVRIQICGRPYEVACEDGQEEHLRVLADEVDERSIQLVRSMGGNPGETMSLLLTALMMADELLETRKNGVNPVKNTEYEAILRADEEELRRREQRMAEMEASMARTLDEVANRIEAIAQQIEMG